MVTLAMKFSLRLRHRLRFGPCGIGTAIALSRTVEYYVYPYIVALQSMPKVDFGAGIMI